MFYIPIEQILDIAGGESDIALYCANVERKIVVVHKATFDFVLNGFVCLLSLCFCFDAIGHYLCKPFGVIDNGFEASAEVH